MNKIADIHPREVKAVVYSFLYLSLGLGRGQERRLEKGTQAR